MTWQHDNDFEYDMQYKMKLQEPPSRAINELSCLQTKTTWAWLKKKVHLCSFIQQISQVQA